MSSAAPIKESQEVKNAFYDAKSGSSFGFLQIEIELKSSQFILVTSEEAKETPQKTWLSIQKKCKPENHAFFVTRDYKNSNLFKLIHFAPDLSPVQQRMIYASSRSTLRSMLGNANFTSDLHVNHPEEIDLDDIIKKENTLKTIDFRSEAEIEKDETAYEASAKSSKSNLLQKLPITLTNEGKTALERFANGEIKCVTLSLTQDEKSITAEEQKAEGIDQIRALMKPNLPSYLLFYHTNAKIIGSQPEKLFGYFCPDKADRKLKFTYSTARLNVLDYLKEANIEVAHKVEFHGLEDLTGDYIEYIIIPHKHAPTQAVKKIAGPGSRKKTKKKTFTLGDHE